MAEVAQDTQDTTAGGAVVSQNVIDHIKRWGRQQTGFLVLAAEPETHPDGFVCWFINAPPSGEGRGCTMFLRAKNANEELKPRIVWSNDYGDPGAYDKIVTGSLNLCCKLVGPVSSAALLSAIEAMPPEFAGGYKVALREAKSLRTPTTSQFGYWAARVEQKLWDEKIGTGEGTAARFRICHALRRAVGMK